MADGHADFLAKLDCPGDTTNSSTNTEAKSSHFSQKQLKPSSQKQLKPSSLTDSSYLPSSTQQSQALFHYDITLYPFDQLIYKIFQMAILPDKTFLPNSSNISYSLAQLHTSLRGYTGRTNRSTFFKAWKLVLSKSCPLPLSMSQQFVTKREELYFDFSRLLHKFVRHECATILGCAPDDMYYQLKPTLRVIVPSTKSVGHSHTDYEYHHQPGELNFWIPLTPVAGANSLHCESAPGVGDFSPMVAQHGQAIKFWGNQCQHYTVPNTTELTRVSFDFRVIEKRKFNAHFVDIRGKETKFLVGGYYQDSCKIH